jgi:phosphoserine phosphatase RsbU/P
MSPSRRYRNYFFLIPLFALALFYQIGYTIVLLNLELHGYRIVDSPFNVAAGSVRETEPNADEAGLRRGDQILAIDDRPLESDRGLNAALRKHHPGEALVVTVLRTGEPRIRTLHIPLRPRRPASISVGYWALAILSCAVKLFCVFLGIYVAAVIPNDPRAVIFFGLMVGTSLVWNSAGWYDFPRWLWAFADLFLFAGAFTWGLWLVCFSLYFPERFAWDLRHPWIKWTFLGPLIVYSVLVIADTDSAFYSERALSILQPLTDEMRLVTTACVTFFFAALATKTGIARTRDAKRRLRVLYFGSVIGLAPIGCVILYEFLVSRSGWRPIPDPIIIPVLVLFCVFPATLAYVIVVERAMDVRMVIRQGVRYTLARGGLRLVLSAATVGLIFWVSTLVFPSRMSPAVQIGVFVSAIIVISLLVRATSKRLALWIDRRFFREEYNAQLILEDLGETVRTIVDQDRLLDTVARRISESLHVPQFAVLLNDGGEFRPVYCLGLNLRPELLVPEKSKTVQVVNESKEPPQIFFDREDNWIHKTTDTELVTLKALHAQLLLPVGSKDKLLGILSLGPKLSEEPYSRTDVQLLRSVALQTGLALENSRLAKAIAEEAAQRERMNREIEIAREVQERLFPQRLPVIAGIDYSGACRPALGVGGDYYDFLALPNGDLGIAIGDVSGKGIAAALLMASLQASLRGQALMGHGDLARLMANVNQLVYEATPPNRYATFFYGQYSHDTRVFTYVNAGHNPPIVLRRTKDGTIHVIRLETGGPVIGLFPNVPYQQGSFAMEPGDIFVGFTDGISEAMNPQEEEWGEERLIPAVEKNADRSAADLIPALMAEADRFASGAPQHDDMTLVVVKMCEAA